MKVEKTSTGFGWLTVLLILCGSDDRVNGLPSSLAAPVELEGANVNNSKSAGGSELPALQAKPDPAMDLGGKQEIVPLPANISTPSASEVDSKVAIKKDAANLDGAKHPIAKETPAPVLNEKVNNRLESEHGEEEEDEEEEENMEEEEEAENDDEDEEVEQFTEAKEEVNSTNENAVGADPGTNVDSLEQKDEREVLEPPVATTPSVTPKLEQDVTNLDGAKHPVAKETPAPVLNDKLNNRLESEQGEEEEDEEEEENMEEEEEAEDDDEDEEVEQVTEAKKEANSTNEKAVGADPGENVDSLEQRDEREVLEPPVATTPSVTPKLEQVTQIPNLTTPTTTGKPQELTQIPIMTTPTTTVKPQKDLSKLHARYALHYNTRDQHMLQFRELRTTKEHRSSSDWIEVDVVCTELPCNKLHMRMFFDGERRLRSCVENLTHIDYNTFPNIDPLDSDREYFHFIDLRPLSGEKLRDACLHHASPVNTKEVLARKRRDAVWEIFPGTLYCGPGNISTPNGPPALARLTDQCCKAHDECSDAIKPYTTKYGYYNNVPVTTSNCECDDAFFDCLGETNTKASLLVGNFFFDFAKMKCFLVEDGKAVLYETYGFSDEYGQ